MKYLGCHLSVSGGYLHMGREASSIGANTFQFFTRNPRGGAFKVPAPEDVSALVAYMEENGFGPVIAHAPYVLNPCAADESIREYTAQTMKEDVDLLEAIPGAYYNFHPGCHVGQGTEIGIAKTAETIRTILSGNGKTVVLIETMAGKGSEIGKTFEEVREMIDRVEGNARVGVCLDTCHVSDGGYDIAGDPDRVFTEFDRVIGLDRLRAIHLNDSKNPLGAHKDRHETIGNGYLTLDGIRRIVTHPVVRELPVCLETPNDLAGYAKEIALLKEIGR